MGSREAAKVAKCDCRHDRSMSIEDAKDDVPSGTEFEKPEGFQGTTFPKGKEFEKAGGLRSASEASLSPVRCEVRRSIRNGVRAPLGVKYDVPSGTEFEHR